MATPTRFTPEMFARYRKLGYWTGMRLADYWDQNAELYPDREALVDSRARLTWTQAKLWIDRIALGLIERGFKKDDMLAVQLPNCVELVLLRIAAEKAGILCAPVLRTFRQKEMEYILAHTTAKGIVIPWRYSDFDYFQMVSQIRPRLPQLEHIFAVWDEIPPGAIPFSSLVETPIESNYPADFLKKTICPDDEYSLVLTTSGTTGFPKFVEHPVCSRRYIGQVYADAWKMTADDVVGIFGPAATGPNNAAYCSSPLVASRSVILEHFEGEAALRLIEKEKVTLTGLVPAQIALMLRCPDFARYDLGSLRLICCTSAPLSYHLGIEAEKKFGCPIVQTYGSVDAGGSMMHDAGDSQEVRLLTAGHPMAGVEVKLVDDDGNDAAPGAVGEVWVRGPTFVSGCYKDPEATAHAWTKDGWFRMGDLGRFDDRGNLAIAGRKKDMIIRGGQNIYPVEIENLLVTHPSVNAVAVVAMPDPVMGEKACAFIIPKAGGNFTFDEMVSFLKQMDIALFKIPERLELVDRFPMVAAGQKVDKKALAQLLRDKVV